MNVLVLNCGSATLKAKLFVPDGAALRATFARTLEVAGDYGAAIAEVLAALPGRPDVVGHRVVHGGARFVEPVVVDATVERELAALAPLAPLHMPPALAGIAATRSLGVPLVAVFDTAFHATLPEAARRYALPASVGPEVRRYGFHGLSHRSVMESYAKLAGHPRPTIVTLHLGQGCSAAAIEDGACVDTSMGMSPLEGLVMGTRPGDLDPAIVPWLLRSGKSQDEVERMLNRESGLLALAGTADMREILARDDESARFALDVFCRRVKKYLGAYLALLGRAEAVVFTGGIGENSPEVRRRVLAGLERFGVVVDGERNARGGGRISSDASSLDAFALATDEEAVIACDAVACSRRR